MLRLEEVCVTLGDFSLEKISLHVASGTYLVLLGPTGTGKTVLLETIAGLYRSMSGRIHLNGKDITRLSPEARHLGIVYQDYALFPHLSVLDNIAFGLRLGGIKRREIKSTVTEMAEFLEIEHLLKRRPIRLSGGERQRVALARALVMKPYVLLLDEPLSALDRASRDRIQNELKRIHTELSVTIIHITHNLSEAFFLADHLAVMKNGRILQEGPTNSLFLRPENRNVAEMLGIENLIDATAGKEKLVTALGEMEMRPLFAAGGPPAGRICLTVPAACIELFPEKIPEEYLWMGRVKISGIRHMAGNILLSLIHEGGECLKTSLSMREAEAFGTAIKADEEVSIGIRRKGVHWVAQTGPT